MRTFNMKAERNIAAAHTIIIAAAVAVWDAKEEMLFSLEVPARQVKNHVSTQAYPNSKQHRRARPQHKHTMALELLAD